MSGIPSSNLIKGCHRLIKKKEIMKTFSKGAKNEHFSNLRKGSMGLPDSIGSELIGVALREVSRFPSK